MFYNQYIKMQSSHIENMGTLVSLEEITTKWIPLQTSRNAVIRIFFHVLYFTLLPQPCWFPITQQIASYSNNYIIQLNHHNRFYIPH